MVNNSDLGGGPEIPSLLAELKRRWRPHLPVLLIAGAVVLAGVGVVSAYRAERSHQETVDRVLADYGQVVAFNYTETWKAVMQDAFGATLAVARGAAYRGTTTAQCVNTLLNPPAYECDCIRLAGDWAFHLDFSGPTPQLLFGGEPPSESDQRRVAEEIRSRIRTPGRASHQGIVWIDLAGRSTPIAYQSLLNVFQDTVAYGVVIDPNRLRETFQKAFADGRLLPPSLTDQAPNHQLVEVVVENRAGDRVFAWPGEPALEHEAVFAPSGDGVELGAVRASIQPGSAKLLVIGGLPRSRIPFLLFVFGLAGALAIMAGFQMRRERALARVRQDFVASVSHELRTPLAQIRLFVETLRLGRARTDEERDWSLENIDRETLRLVRLVENVLAFDRAEHGGGLTELRPLDLAQEARDAVEAFRPLISGDRAELEVDVPDGLGVEGDADALRQVLLNLLDNAVKYGPRGQTVRISGHRSGEWVQLWVDDEGPGIPPREREEIFSPYNRGGDTLGGSVAGSGIGLAVVRQIARAHGGEARVEAAPGGGARFILQVPAVLTVTEARMDSGGGREGQRSAGNTDPREGDDVAGGAA